jgi:hypothetical protein
MENNKAQDLSKETNEIIGWMMQNKAIDQTLGDFFLDIKKYHAFDKKEKEKIDYLAHIAATIESDPIRAKNCHAKCYGRGFRYIDVSKEKGEIHYKIDLCCGVVGKAPYAKLIDEIMQLKHQINAHEKTSSLSHQGICALLDMHDKSSDKHFEEVKKYQLFRKIYNAIKPKKNAKENNK